MSKDMGLSERLEKRIEQLEKEIKDRKLLKKSLDNEELGIIREELSKLKVLYKDMDEHYDAEMEFISKEIAELKEKNRTSWLSQNKINENVDKMMEINHEVLQKLLVNFYGKTPRDIKKLQNMLDGEKEADNDTTIRSGQGPLNRDRSADSKPPKFLSDDWIKEKYEQGLKEGKWLEYPPRESPSECKHDYLLEAQPIWKIIRIRCLLCGDTRYLNDSSVKLLKKLLNL